MADSNRSIADHGVGVDEDFLVNQGLLRPEDALTAADYRELDAQRLDDRRLDRHGDIRPGYREITRADDEDTEPAPEPGQGSAATPEQIRAARDQEWQRAIAEQQTQRANAIPELEQDPVGHFVGRLNAHEQVLTQQYQAAVYNNAVNELGRLESQYAQENPDYRDSAVYLLERRDKELELMGMKDERQRLDHLIQETRQLCVAAGAQGKNPAAVVYDLAVNAGFAARGYRRGYSPSENLDRIARGQRQGRSVSQVRGTPPRGTPGARALSTMSMADFEKHVGSAAYWNALGA